MIETIDTRSLTGRSTGAPRDGRPVNSASASESRSVHREGLSILESSLYVLAAQKVMASFRNDGASPAELGAEPKVVIEELNRVPEQAT